MYRQVLVHEADQKYQSLLWGFDPEQPVNAFCPTTVTFGMAPSAFLTRRVIKEMAKQHAFEYPLGAQVLEKETYVDDTLSGGHSIAEAKAKQQEAHDIQMKSVFKLRKFVSSNAELLSHLPEDLLAKECTTLFNDCNYCTWFVLAASD